MWGARQVNEPVKVLLLKNPLDRENAPQTFQSPEETLHQDASAPEAFCVVTTDDNATEVSLSTDIAKVGQHRPVPQQLIQLVFVGSQDDNAMDAPGVCLRDDGCCPRSNVDSRSFFKA